MIEFNWQSQKSPFGLTEQERDRIETFISLNAEHSKKVFEEDPKVPLIRTAPNVLLKYDVYGFDGKLGGKSPSRWIYFIRDDTLVDTNIVLGSGGQANVYQLYSPLTGKCYAVKNLADDLDNREGQIWAYNTLKGKPGCVQCITIAGGEVIEPCYDGTLQDELKKKNLKSTAAKIDAMREIAIGINSIHSELYTKIWFINGRQRRFKSNLSHGDIKPSNIFVNTRKNRLQMDIGDYGFTAVTNRIAQSGYYLSPQAAETSLSEATEMERAQFNHDLGLQNDIWELGIVYASILKNTLIDGYIPPLKFTKNTKSFNREEKARIFAKLKQDQIDQEIRRKIKKINGSTLDEKDKVAMKKCWKIVQGMLQVAPHKRLYIEKIQKKIRRIEQEHSQP